MARGEQQERAEEVLALAKREKVRFINLQFVDTAGLVKNVTVPSHEFAECIERGKWFDGSSIEGFARVAESDMYLKPDLSTFAIIPWERGDRVAARVICAIHKPNGEPFPGDPRFVLQRTLEELPALGYAFYTGPEFEFFLFKIDEDGNPKPAAMDRASYFDLSTDTSAQIREDIVNALEDFGIPVESVHHEMATGQHEIDLKYDGALKAADNAVTLKYTVKAVAQRHGLYATFMPKPVRGVAGSGMHTHQSFFRLDDNTNAFYSEVDRYGLSDVAKHFIAGQMAHARGMCAIMSPLVNSYKRLVPGYSAPVYISWARINRSALIRIPQFTPGNQRATRVELRCPDASCNPYLAFAVMLKCGLDGIKKELPLPAPVEENLYQFDSKRLKQHEIKLLPSSLVEALEELRQDVVVHEALGEHVYQRFLEAKQVELDAYRREVTSWEIENYLPIF